MARRPKTWYHTGAKRRLFEEEIKKCDPESPNRREERRNKIMTQRNIHINEVRNWERGLDLRFGYAQEAIGELREPETLYQKALHSIGYTLSR